MNMRSDGTENCTAYAKFALDSRGIWFGESYDLVNNHVKNSYEIQLFNSHGYIKTVLRKKEETLNLNEFKKWLFENGVDDAYMNFLRSNKWYCDKYPKSMGIEFV